MTKEIEAENKKATKFSKNALLDAEAFSNRKDALKVVIKDGETLTIEEANARLEKFMKRKVE